MKRKSIVSAAILLMMAACNTPAASVTEAPTIAPTSVPPTSTAAPPVEPTEAPIHTPTPISQFKSFPRTNCCNGTPVEPGEYELPVWVGIPLTLELGEGWQVVNEEAARLFMLGKGENIFNDPTQALVFVPIQDEDPQLILGSIKSEKGLTPQGEMTETTIAGFPGMQLDLSANPNPGYEGDKQSEIPPGVQFLTSVGRYFAEGFNWTTWSAEARLRFIALDMGEDVLLLQIDAPPAEFETFAAEADQVLQTLELRK
jgi:hypothetical protein